MAALKNNELTFPNSPNVNGVTTAMCLKQVAQSDNVSTFKFTLPYEYNNRTPVLFIMAGQNGSTLVVSFLPTAGEPHYDVIHGTATVTYNSSTGIVTVTASNLSWGVGAYFIGPEFLIKTIDNLS
jgi:hypothetical protein